MNKLTFQEIINKLKTFYKRVDQFAFEHHYLNIDDFPEAKKANNEKIKFFEEHYIKNKWDSKDNREIYYSMPDPFQIAKELYSKQEDSLVWEEVEQYGGEGQGDTWYSVKYFPDHNIYLRVDGWYQSYNGTEFSGWDSVKEVKPIQKTITVYE